MSRRWFPPIVDVARREIRLSKIWITTSLLHTLAIGFLFVIIMAMMP